MTREPRAREESRLVRASGNTLFYNNLHWLFALNTEAGIARRRDFAQSCANPQSKQQAERAEHRPASRPGAD
jgi:hypothetical protein